MGFNSGFKGLNVSPVKSQILSFDTVVANGRYDLCLQTDLTNRILTGAQDRWSLCVKMYLVQQVFIYITSAVCQGVH